MSSSSGRVIFIMTMWICNRCRSLISPETLLQIESLSSDLLFFFSVILFCYCFYF
jgi:hypothetical protein